MADERRNPRSGPAARSSAGAGRSGSSRGGPAGSRGSGQGAQRGQSSQRGQGGQGGRGGKQDWKRPADQQGPRTADQERYDGPPIPDDITGGELDRSVSAQLKGMPEKLAARVARHLAAAGMILDEDPETAYKHTLAARARAPRLAVVREAVGETAYAAGHYSEALSELRAAKRMNGATAYLPIMADCHRALGNPEQAIKLAKSPGVANFDPEPRAEMTIVEAGARRDMGQYDAALRVLEQSPMASQNRSPWMVRLRYTYAETLVLAGRDQDALTWFHRTHAIDSEELTDAAARAEEIERRMPDEDRGAPLPMD